MATCSMCGAKLFEEHDWTVELHCPTHKRCYDRGFPDWPGPFVVTEPSNRDGHWRDCHLHHGGERCDMGDECGSWRGPSDEEVESWLKE